jgi:hypothetical protein
LAINARAPAPLAPMSLTALMTVPIDDHMVHRGHAVFDTATLTHGRVYRLDVHLSQSPIAPAYRGGKFLSRKMNFGKIMSLSLKIG